MIIFGVVLIVIGLLWGATFLVGFGVIAMVIGFALIALGRSGRPLAGRTYWY